MRKGFLVPEEGSFAVILTLNPLAEGGRQGAIASGYRANCWIGNVSANGVRSYNDGHFYLETLTSLEPGSTGVARLVPAIMSSWVDVEVGQTIDVREGLRIVGTAVTSGVPGPLGSDLR
jgi:hypothetical protein